MLGTGKIYTGLKNPWFLAGVLLAVGSIVFYQSVKYNIIDNKITRVIAAKTDSLYRVSYDSISINEAAGDLFIYNLKVTGDTLLQQRYIHTGDTAAASMLVDLLVPVLKIEGFKSAGAVLAKELSCGTIYINDPKITAYLFPGVKKPQPIANQQQELYKQLLGKFDLIQADRIAIINAEVVGKDFMSREIKFHTFNTSLHLSDVRIDSVGNADTTRTLFSKQLYLHTDKFMAGENPTLFEATNVTFDTRKKVFNIAELIHNGIQSGGTFSAILRELTVTGLMARGPVDSLELEIGKVSVGRADVTTIRKEKGGQSKSGAKPKTLLNGWIKSFTLARLQSVAINVKLMSENDKQQETAIKNVAVSLSGLTLNTTTTMDKSLLSAADNIKVSNDLVSIKSKDGMYVFNFKGIAFDKRAATVRLRALEVKPLLSEVEFAAKAKVQKDRFDVQVNNVLASGVDVDAWFDGKMSISKVQANNSFIKIYRDITLPMDSIRKVGKYPHQMLRKLSVPLYIKQFVAANTYIQYKERNPLSDTSGSVTFEKSTLELTNVTNAANPAVKTMDLHFNGRLLGQIPLELSIKFYLEQIEKGNYQVNGKIDRSFKGEVLNKLIVPLGMVRIDKGKINALSFNYLADNINAQGKFTIKYNDLKLSLLKRKEDQNKFNKKGLLSFLANVVVKNNNPANGKLRQADVVYKRDEYKSFFNMLWKFVFTGMKDVMGAKF